METTKEMELSEVSLEAMARGAVIEKFNDELFKVIENIADPNTEANLTRKIMIQLTFGPSKDRRAAQVTIKTTSRLAPTIAVETLIHIGKMGGKLKAFENNPEQLTIPGEILKMEKGSKVGGNA